MKIRNDAVFKCFYFYFYVIVTIITIKGFAIKFFLSLNFQFFPIFYCNILKAIYL